MRGDNGGVGVHVEVDGPDRAPAVLLLHGISYSSATYRFLVPDLVDHYRLYRLDFRGHGRSDRAPGAYHLGDYAGDASAVIEQLVGGPTLVVGHSLGGLTAAFLAQHRPDDIVAVFLEDPPLYLGDRASFEATPFAAAFRLRQTAVRRWQADGLDGGAIAAQLAVAPSMSGAGTMGEETMEDGLTASGESLSLLDPAVFDPVLDGTSRGGEDADAPIRVPGLVLQADPTMGAAFFGDHAERLVSTSPSMRVIALDGVGHRIHDSRTHRAIYRTHLRQFLEAHT